VEGAMTSPKDLRVPLEAAAIITVLSRSHRLRRSCTVRSPFKSGLFKQSTANLECDYH
jgi:hypothetical protein